MLNWLVSSFNSKKLLAISTNWLNPIQITPMVLPRIISASWIDRVENLNRHVFIEFDIHATICHRPRLSTIWYHQPTPDAYSVVELLSNGDDSRELFLVLICVLTAMAAAWIRL